MVEKVVERTGVLERKAIIKNAGMSEDMQQDAIECASQEVWDEVILPKMLKSVHDDVEQCRELAIRVLTFSVHYLVTVDRTFVFFTATLLERIGLPIMEKSEEVRLLLLQLLKSLVHLCSAGTLATNLESISQVLIVALADQFHEIKKEASAIITSIVEHNQEVSAHILENLLKASVPNLKHPHSKVRIATLEGINSMMRCNVPANAVLTLLVPAAQNLVFDKVECVRKFFFHSVAGWLDYKNESSLIMEDKLRFLRFNSRAPQLLPLLLCGIFDSSEEVGSTALLLVEDIGNLYTAFSSKIKDIMMISDAQDGSALTFNGRSHYAGEREMNYLALLPAPFKGRPGKNCCMLVQDLLDELIKPINYNLQEWSETIRCGAARLLLGLLVMAEQQADAYLHLIVPALCSAVGDDNLCIAKLLVRSSHILGWHTSPHAWLSLVLGQVSSSAATSTQVANALVIISGLLHGTKKEAADKDLAKEVIQHLININLRFIHHESIHHQTLAILTNLVKACGSACKELLTEILFVLLQVEGFGSDSTLKQAVSELEEFIAHSLRFSCTVDLYETQADHLLKMVTAEHESWSTDSYGQALFQVLLQKIKSLAGPYLGELLPIMKGCLHLERDPSLRIKFLQLLDELFEDSKLAPYWSFLAPIVLGQILVPCGIWRVGKVGAAVRHAAMVALGTFLRRDLCKQSDLESLLQSNQVLPVVLSCLEEDYYVDIRLVTCNVLDCVLRICGKSLNEKQREEIKKGLQDRLDDSNDDVRLRVLPAISSFFCTMPTSYSDTSARTFVTSILVHMDDSNLEIREHVFKALQVCTSLRPAIVEELVKSKCGEHQMKEYCDYLLAKASSSQNIETPSKVGKYQRSTKRSREIYPRRVARVSHDINHLSCVPPRT